MDTLTSVLPQIPNITTFNYCAQGFSPNIAFVASLAASSASLTTLELTTVFFSHDAASWFSRFSGLHRLLVKQPEGSTLLSASEHKRSLSIQCVANLVLACHTTLNYLELPGEFCPLESFTTGVTLFPALKILILRGYPPLDAERFPLWTVLRSMPRLSKLEIFCRLRVIGANAYRYVLMPKDASPALGEASLFPSQLETLTISNPSLADRLFCHLPTSLRHLFLDFVPDWENMLSSKDSLAYHRPAEMLKLLLRMETMNCLDDALNLEELRIKMGWCATPEILCCISRMFPHLKVLEFQGLRYVDRGTEPESDMVCTAVIYEDALTFKSQLQDSCIKSLSNLHHLHTLKIAMELREDSYEYTTDLARNVGSVRQTAQKWANALAARVPGLQWVAFETRPHTGRGLGPRVLVGPPSWTWFSSLGSNLETSSMIPVEEPSGTQPEGDQGRESRWGLPQGPPDYQPI